MLNILKKISKFVHREILRDTFLLEIKRWFRDDGDNTLRLDYPLNPGSVVWDVGGYRGDFAEQIHSRYSSRVFVFEPHPAFYQHCVDRFSGKENIKILKFGLSDQAGWFDIVDSEDGSSFVNKTLAGTATQKAQLCSVAEVFERLGSHNIDLLKINIEGGEFSLLPALVAADLIPRVRFIQVQFHNFIPNADAMRDTIRAELAKTHDLMWDYTFVWESWMRKDALNVSHSHAGITP
jgi:FkbM family methyltransferase